MAKQQPVIGSLRKSSAYWQLLQDYERQKIPRGADSNLLKYLIASQSCSESRNSAGKQASGNSLI